MLAFRETIKAPFVRHADTFGKLVRANKVNFRKAKKAELDQTGLSIVVNMLAKSKIKWTLGDIGVLDKKGQHPSYVLKLEHSELKFVDVFPCTGQFMWIVGEDHSDSVDFMTASMWLFAAALGPQAVVVTEVKQEFKEGDIAKLRVISIRKTEKGGARGVS